MSETLIIECPACRARIQVARGRGQKRFSCQNGHRFLHTFAGASRHPFRTPFLAFVVVVLAILALLLVRWNGQRRARSVAFTVSVGVLPAPRA